MLDEKLAMHHIHRQTLSFHEKRVFRLRGASITHDKGQTTMGELLLARYHGRFNKQKIPN